MQSAFPRRRASLYVVITLFSSLLPWVAPAQLVPDGGTNIFDAVATNVTGTLTIGINAPFTFLLLTNSATLTNTGIATIGQNANAKSNTVLVVGAGSIWESQGGTYIGSGGAFNTLSILDGALVTNQFAYIGSAANSNTVIVSGTNSFWNMQWSRTGQYGSLRVGSTGSGNTLVITNGGKVADGFAYIGENTASAGNTVIVTGPGSVWSHLNNTIQMGNNGSGNLLLVTNGGLVTGGQGSIGFQGTNNSVVVTGTNSLWNMGSLTINSAFNQLLIQGGGMVSNITFSTVGQYGNSNTACVTDPGSLWTNSGSLVVGYGARGNQLVVSNGATIAVDHTQVGANSGHQNKAIITGAGSILTNRTDFFLGFAGSSNQLLVANGGKLANDVGYVGYDGFNAISNHATITDPNSVWTNRGNLNIGYNAARSFMLVSNGGEVFNENGLVGPNSSGSNIVMVTGSGSLWGNRSDLILGYIASSNQLVVSNGGTVTARTLTLGFSSVSSNNLLTVNGGNVILSNFLNSADLNVRRGTVVLNSGLVQLDRVQMNTGTAGKFNFNGGTLRTLNANVVYGSAFTVGDGTNTATYVLANNQLTTGTHSFNNGLIVSSNALLTGAGTVNANVFIRDGGTISPGTTNILHLTLNGSLVLSNASFTSIQLNAQSATCSHFEGNTDVTYGGTLQLTNIAGTLASGMAFRLFYATNYHGAFSAITPATPGLGRKWNTSQLIVDGTLRIVNAQTPPPTIVSANRAADDLVIQAGDGIPYDPCYLLTSTNLFEWQYAATNAFDASGNVTLTHAISLDEPSRFYRLQVE